MSKPATGVFATARQADSLTRADALEREITDLCAQINAASYRLLLLIGSQLGHTLFNPPHHFDVHHCSS